VSTERLEQGVDYRALAETLIASKRLTGKHQHINELLCDVRGWRKLPLSEVEAKLAADPLAVAAAWELTLAARHLDAHAPGEGQFLRPFSSTDFLKHMIYLGVTNLPEAVELPRTYVIARHEPWDALVFLQLVLRWAKRFAHWQPYNLRELKRVCLSHPFVVAVLDGAATQEDALLAAIFADLGITVLKQPPDVSAFKLAGWLSAELGLKPRRMQAKQQKLDFRQAGGTQNSLFVVRAMGGVDGFDVRGVIGEDIGLIIDIGDKQVTNATTAYLEQHVLRVINENTDLSIQAKGRDVVLRWYDTRLNAEDLGSIIYQALKDAFTLGIISVNLLFDSIRIASLRPSIYSYQEERGKQLAHRSEEREPFVLCRSCSCYAPHAFCVASVDHPPCCHRSYDELATMAQYTRSSEQMTIDRGICQDSLRGNYLGANKIARLITKGHVTDINLHSLRELPHPSTALSQCLVWRIEELDVLGVMGRGFMGRSPDGKTADGLLARAAGIQAPGYAGVGEAYLQSPRFLASEGGLARVGWMNSELKARLAVHAEHIATEKDCINLAGLKEHLAAWRH
jgi:hypothetical protein